MHKNAQKMHKNVKKCKKEIKRVPKLRLFALLIFLNIFKTNSYTPISKLK